MNRTQHTYFREFWREVLEPKEDFPKCPNCAEAGCYTKAYTHIECGYCGEITKVSEPYEFYDEEDLSWMIH